MLVLCMIMVPVRPISNLYIVAPPRDSPSTVRHASLSQSAPPRVPGGVPTRACERSVSAAERERKVVGMGTDGAMSAESAAQNPLHHKATPRVVHKLYNAKMAIFDHPVPHITLYNRLSDPPTPKLYNRCSTHPLCI